MPLVVMESKLLSGRGPPRKQNADLQTVHLERGREENHRSKVSFRSLSNPLPPRLAFSSQSGGFTRAAYAAAILAGRALARRSRAASNLQKVPPSSNSP